MSGYDDIINLPYVKSKTRPHMSNYDRAAQFSPFAALTGYDAAIAETGRLTDQNVELDEQSRAILDDKLLKLQEVLHEQPQVTVTYFVPDARKSGGEYVTKQGSLKRIDPYAQMLVFIDGIKIAICDILELEFE